MKLLIALLVGALASMASESQAAGSSAATQPAAQGLETVEDRSESVANRLLELSVAVRDRDAERIASFFAEPAVVTGMPAKAGAETTDVKDIRRHGFELEEARSRGRAEIEAAWRGFLDHFSSVEDSRFKLKGATFADDGNGRGRVAFFIIGRDRQGRREWVRGSAAAAVFSRLGPDDQWLISEMRVESLDAMIAPRDLWSEVGEPAGVAAPLPAYGDAPSQDYLWHGAAAGDVDGDGTIDLVVTGPERSYLYLNDGEGRFRDAAEETGIRLATGTAPLLLDKDNDGDLDLFMANVGPQLMFENRLIPDHELSFWDVSLEAGVGSSHCVGFSATAADVNHDGRPDIYVASYNHYGEVVPDSWSQARNGTPNLLFVSQPDGTYHQEARKWGVDDSRWSYAAVFADLTGDGALDLFVANDFGEKALYVRHSDRFVDEAAARGALDPGNGMGVSVGDFDNDGILDLYATNMSSTAGNRILARLFPDAGPGNNVLKKLAAGNALLRGSKGGTFRDVTAAVGGFAGGWAWGGGFIDVDNDGWQDVYAPNGFISGKSMKDT